MRTPTLVLVNLLLLGCPTRSSIDEVAVCLTSRFDEPVQVVDEGDTLTFYATGGTGCPYGDYDLTCTATVDGTAITVTTEATWRRTSVGLTCEDMAIIGEVTCSTPPLDGGSYTITYGDGTWDVDLPGEVEGCLD